MNKNLKTLVNMNAYAPVDVFISDRETLKKGITFQYNTHLESSFNLFLNLSKLIHCSHNKDISSISRLFKKIPHALLVFSDEILEVKVTFKKNKWIKEEVLFEKHICLGNIKEVIDLKNNSLIKFNKACNEISLQIKLIDTKDHEQMVFNSLDQVVNSFEDSNVKLKNNFISFSASDKFEDHEEYTKEFLSFNHDNVTELLDDTFQSILFYSEYLDREGFVNLSRFKDIRNRIQQRYSIFSSPKVDLKSTLNFIEGFEKIQSKLFV